MRIIYEVDVSIERLFVENSFSARSNAMRTAMTSFLPTCPANEALESLSNRDWLFVRVETGHRSSRMNLTAKQFIIFENSSFNYHIRVIGFESLKRSLRISQNVRPRSPSIRHQSSRSLSILTLPGKARYSNTFVSCHENIILFVIYLKISISSSSDLWPAIP